MAPLEQRVRHALERAGNQNLTPWAGLMALHRADREAFYLLACDGVGDGADSTLRILADLANRIRLVVRSSYQIAPVASGQGATLQRSMGEVLSLPAEMVTAIKHFLLEVDGKGIAGGPGKDYTGTGSSEAEFRFKLGDRHIWETDRQRLQARRNTVE